MGLFNSVLIDEENNICLQFRYGKLNMSTYQIGERILGTEWPNFPKEFLNARITGVTTEDLTREDQYLYFEIEIVDGKVVSYHGIEPREADRLDAENGDSFYW